MSDRMDSKSMSRESTYDLVDTDKAIMTVIEQAHEAAVKQASQSDNSSRAGSDVSHMDIEQVCVSECIGRILAMDIKAQDPVPSFRASMMDGYAIVAADGTGVFPVVADITAGVHPEFELQSGQVAYITTGAPLPRGADAVVQVELTKHHTVPQQQHVSSSDGTTASVEILSASKAGRNIRPIGCDIAVGEIVLQQGCHLSPADVGLMCTIGITTVDVVREIRVGVMSTGDELVDADQPLIGAGKIRDSNRPMLLSAVKSCTRAMPVDLGLVIDKESKLEQELIAALKDNDVVITSGGVSMGRLDLVKPLLEKLGTVHFGRVRMKPGKPTTFASVMVENRKKLVFALPGNPVSCLVSFHLFAYPAIRVLQGVASQSAQHPRISCRIADDMWMDAVREEYHRCRVFWNAKTNSLIAFSTGVQRSSRLLKYVTCDRACVLCVCVLCVCVCVLF
jgi:gephyrin